MAAAATIAQPPTASPAGSKPILKPAPPPGPPPVHLYPDKGQGKGSKGSKGAKAEWWTPRARARPPPLGL
eukprot:5653670-Alexandrium_andersonii.AAC.1